jgi:hypothetical protein
LGNRYLRKRTLPTVILENHLPLHFCKDWYWREHCLWYSWETSSHKYCIWHCRDHCPSRKILYLILKNIYLMKDACYSKEHSSQKDAWYSKEHNSQESHLKMNEKIVLKKVTWYWREQEIWMRRYSSQESHLILKRTRKMNEKIVPKKSPNTEENKKDEWEDSSQESSCYCRKQSCKQNTLDTVANITINKYNWYYREQLFQER